jgi:hypothetical protein
MDEGSGEQECLSIAATVFGGIRRRLGFRRRLMFDNNGGGL